MQSLKRVVFSLSLVAALTLSASAQPPQGRGGFPGGGPLGTGPAQLLQAKSVASELKLTDEQVAKVKEWAAGSQAKMREKLQDIPREEMREKLPEIMAEMQKSAKAEIAEILKPEQVKRLGQIEFQMAGLRSFASPENAKALEITDDQRESLTEILRETGRDMRDLGEEYGARFGQPPADADKAKEFERKSAQLTKEATEKVMALMTDDQKKKFKEMTGDPVDVAKIRSETQRSFGRKKRNDD